MSWKTFSKSVVMRFLKDAVKYFLKSSFRKYLETKALIIISHYNI